jgi:hypothetical protein
MIGLALVALGCIFSEASISIGKYQFQHKKESLYAMGFLDGFWATVFLIVIAIVRHGEFIFSINSMPTFITRAVLEIILLFVSLEAVTQASRSTFSFLRIITIPLLLVSDIVLGYNIGLMQIIGISLMVLALIFLLINHGLSRGGKLLSIFSALLAVGTITLYKYDISHFNSVEAEQIIMQLILLTALITITRIRTGEHLFRYLVDRTFFLQSIAAGAGSVMLSFAYLYAPASVLTTGKRSFSVLTALASGQKFFREKRLGTKLIATALIIVGLILLTLG